MDITIREQRPADTLDVANVSPWHLRRDTEGEFIALLTAPPLEAVRIVIDADRRLVTHG